MNPSKYAFQAGLFIILSIAATIFLVARVAESRSATRDATTYTAIFMAGEDISGLAKGAEVQLMGVKVGRVESVKVKPPQTAEEDASIKVRFTVGNGVKLRQDNPRIELQTALTGGAWLNILSVGSGEYVADGGEVHADTVNMLALLADVRQEMKLTLASLREEVDEVSTELVETANGIETFAKGASSVIEKIDEEIEQLLAEATGVMTDIRGVFGDSGDDMRTTLANLNTLTTKLDKKLPETLDEITGFVDKAEASIDGVDELITELTGTATEARTMIADNRGDIDRTIESARRSVDELEGLVDDLRANPSRLVWPPDEKDLQNMDLYASARSYAKAAEDLESAASALQEATATGGADAQKLEALRSNLMQQFKHFDTLQEQLWVKFKK